MDLTGQLLIAMPGMSDPRFMRSVVLICSHDDDGAMGLILNKPLQGMRFEEMLEKLDITATADMTQSQIHIGGPVQTERGFVLHEDSWDGALQPLLIRGGFALTATQDILESIAQGSGPSRYKFALGYAGWGQGQLEAEIAQNGWLTAPAVPRLVFDTVAEDVWDSALATIGIDPVSLSGSAGRA